MEERGAPRERVPFPSGGRDSEQPELLPVVWDPVIREDGIFVSLRLSHLGGIDVEFDDRTRSHYSDREILIIGLGDPDCGLGVIAGAYVDVPEAYTRVGTPRLFQELLDTYQPN